MTAILPKVVESGEVVASQILFFDGSMTLGAPHQHEERNL